MRKKKRKLAPLDLLYSFSFSLRGKKKKKKEGGEGGLILSFRTAQPEKKKRRKRSKRGGKKKSCVFVAFINERKRGEPFLFWRNEEKEGTNFGRGGGEKRSS